MPRPSLYDILYGNFAGGLDLNTVSETDQVILSVLDNMQRILNCRAGTLAHLPDYGLPDMTAVLQGDASVGASADEHIVGGVVEIRTAPAADRGGDARSACARRTALCH